MVKVRAHLSEPLGEGRLAISSTRCRPSDIPPQVHTLSLFLLIFQTHTNKPGLFHPEECLLTTTDPFLIVIRSLNYRHMHVSGKSSPQST